MARSRWTMECAARHGFVMLGMLIPLIAFLGVGPMLATTLQAVEVGADKVQLRFAEARAEHGEGPAPARVSVLGAPDRLVIDLPGANVGDRPLLAPGAGGALVERARHAKRGDDTARVVLDLTAPVDVADRRWSADGRTLTLSLRRLAGLDRPRPTAPQAGVLPPRKRYSVAVPLGRPRDGVPLPPVRGPKEAALPLVVIDPGHGGHDPGALSADGSVREKALTLAMARAVRDALLATGRVRVALTREDDRFLALQERYGIARRLKADLFISLHADAATSPDARGASLYTLSEVASDREAARLAARENRANLINGVDLGRHDRAVSSILVDLTQRETMNIASDFARILQREASKQVPFRTDAHRFAGFAVLKAPDVPSLLFETGFISNAADAAFLASKDGQARVAKGVTRAVQLHFARQLAAR